MAIQFARIRYIGRSDGGNACRSSAYNARSKIKDERTGEIFDFTKRGGNIYHEILLPEYVDKKFASAEILSNEIERVEKKCNSQLVAEFLLALDKDLDENDPNTIEIYKAQIYEYIKRKKWIEEGLAVQIDIHKPHEEEINWHCHGLVTTRRFSKCGQKFESTKARDLQPQIRNGYVKNKAEFDNGLLWKDVQNDYYKSAGMPNRVDMISTMPAEHIGPVRMRSILNQAIERNEIRKLKHIQNIKNPNQILDLISKTQSIFTQQDIERALSSVANDDERKELLNKVMSSPRLIQLYDQDQQAEGAKPNGYYSTREVRSQEERILRIASIVHGHSNLTRSLKAQLAVKNEASVSEQQREALQYIIAGQGGIRVLKGRAGTGKSHILGIAAKIASKEGQHVVGLAPTHKAASELRDKGFKDVFTVKGFLFGLYNGRIHLPKHSLVVVDEAGMLASSDMLELMKAAAGHKSSLVLAGDDRQLTSVERGGMFAVLSKKFGTHELSAIKRQSQDWGKEMALELASGNIAAGIDILIKNEGLVASASLDESVAALLGKWQTTSGRIEEKLIITVRNRDVDILNDSVREILKKNGYLTGKGVVIQSKEKVGDKLVSVRREFAVGDRIMFATTNKKLAIENGEFATLLEVNKGQFVAQLDGKEEKIVTFSPEVINLRYAYAVTTYKSQGASIRQVYILHSGVGNSRSSYVNLTRHVENVALFYDSSSVKNRPPAKLASEEQVLEAYGAENRSVHRVREDLSTGVTTQLPSEVEFHRRSDIWQLKQQLSSIDDKCASVEFLTLEDIKALGQAKDKGVIGKFGNWVKTKLVQTGDRLHHNYEYYQFNLVPVEAKVVEEILDVTYQAGLQEEVASTQETGEIAMVAGGANSMVNRNRKTPKEAFYARVARSRAGNIDSTNHKPQTEIKFTRDYKAELEELKSELKFNTEKVARNLLGEPNSRLSNGRVLRYGKKGSLVVAITGHRRGTWYDFEQGKGGDLIELAQNIKGADFKDVAEYLKSLLGVSRAETLKLVDENRIDNKYQNRVYEDAKEQEKHLRDQNKIQKLYSGSRVITEKSVAAGYLSKERGISCAPEEDIRTIGIWDKETQKRYPAIVAFARDSEGKVTGGQQILLDPETIAKATVHVPKKSFGKIGGSFVVVQKSQSNEAITTISEGLETALSIKDAGIQGKILCSLGIGNIKNYQAKEGELILLAADNDGADAKTAKIVEKAAEHLRLHGAIVHIVRPKEQGDFNDILKQQGKDVVAEIMQPAIKELLQDDGTEKIFAALNEIMGEDVMAATSSLRASTCERGNPEKLEHEHTNINMLKHNITMLQKHCPNKAYKILKVYKEQGLEAANKAANENIKAAIITKIEANIESLKLAAQQNKTAVITDFDNYQHHDSISYLCTIGSNQQIMAYLESTSWHKKIQVAKVQQQIIVDDNRKQLEFTFRLHQEKLEDIASFEPTFDQRKLASELYTLPEQAQNQKILDLWTKTFKDHIATPLDEIDRQKQQAKTIDQYLAALTEQKEFSGKYFASHRELLRHGSNVCKDERAELTMFLTQDKPSFAQELGIDLKHGIEHGIWTEEQALKRLNSGQSLRALTCEFFEKCQQHQVSSVLKDLEHITQAGKLEKDNIQFTTHKAYLEHCINHPQLKTYLECTPVTAKLDAIHKHEAHQLAQQKEQEKQQELERQQQELSKHLGKGSFGL